MKKLSIYNSLMILAAVVIFGSCKKSVIDKDYYNPEASVSASVPALYAGLFNNAYVIPRYWNLYTLLVPVFGEYSQTIGYTNGSKVYEQPTNYSADKWNNYYTTVVAQYREIEKYYNNLATPEDKAGFQVFLETAKVFFYDQTTQMIDLWGDVPYSEAGSLNSAGTISTPKYDSAQAVYYSIISDLDRINSYLDTVNLASFYSQQFAAYDYVNSGSLAKWRQYANSLRLRLAMRISYYDEATAKSIVMAMLNDPSTYPMVLTADNSIQIKLTGNLVSTGNDIRNGFGVNPFAPGFMVDSVMVPSSDPRLPVYFTKNASGGYSGVLNTTSAAVVDAGEQANAYSRYDSTTFTENNNFPGIILTAAETNFSIAEAYQRWGNPLAAVSAYNSGIEQSVAFYYSIYNTSSYPGSALTAPSAAQIAAFEADTAIALGADIQNNLRKIATQKWIDFNVMQANQAWIEYRRTGYPDLYFPTDASSVAAPTPPQRLLYPTTESTLNTANYNAVKAKDNISTKVFWDVN